MITFNTFKNSKHLTLKLCSLCLTVFLFSSCSSDDKLDFRSSNDALRAYQDYLSSVKKTKICNTSSFCKEIKVWKEISDTVYHFLMKDSTFIKDLHCANDYASIHDSIRFEFLRLTETWRYSYEDVLQIKEQTSIFHEDNELHEAVIEAQPFFVALDSLPVIESNKKDILSQYRSLLKHTIQSGIHDKDAMLDFIGKEDILFRSFLIHIYEMDNENGEIAARDAMVYMSMRTVRRLLQNSTACISDINNQKTMSKAQGNAYLWMIIQPFISIDQFSIATLTPQEHSHFNYIIAQLPKSVKFAETFGIDQRALNYLLPQQLLKMYVLTL